MTAGNLLENVLVVDDEEGVQEVSMEFFQKIGCNCKVASDASEALTMLHKHSFDLVVSDIAMPGTDGIQFMKEAKKTFPHLDFIIMTGHTSEYMYEDIISAGATDYLAKPYSFGELRAKIRRIEREKRVLKELKETNKQLESAVERANQMALEAEVAKQEFLILSRTDPLTGVFNRRAILSQIETELSRAKREEENLSLSMLDIDYFKEVNDIYGHMAGDVVLQECARRINAVTRTYDSFGRFGGEEFLIVIPGAEEKEVFSICERIRLAVNETDIYIDGSSVRVTVSQGMVVWDRNSNIDDLIARADKALYQAKENGRNRTEQALL